jgi:hypothetical protein
VPPEELQQPGELRELDELRQVELELADVGAFDELGQFG